jgi:dienelactone hydrolase
MNVSHNGVSSDAPMQFTELDRFAQNTYTRELEDVRTVLDAVAGHDLPVEAPVDDTRIGLMGHSRGGGTAILQAARDDRVQALATWAAVSTFIGRFTDAQIRDWTTQGTTEIVNSRTGQTMRLDRVVYDDAMAHRDLLDIEAAAARIDVPWLIVHAEDDEAVDVSAAETLAAATEHATLLKATGGHTFGGSHPHDGAVPQSLQRVWDATIAFFTDHL